MSISAQSAEQIVRILKTKVEAGQIDRGTAEHLAVLALQEVQIADEVAEGDTTNEGEEDLIAPDSEEDKPAPLPPSMDPSAQILIAVNEFDQATASIWTGTKAKIENTLKGVQGEAFPLGTFSSTSKTGEKGNSTQVTIQKGNANTVEISFKYGRDWNLTNVTPPETVAASVVEEPACHLGLRKELLALAQDISDISDSELIWNRSRLPEGTLAYLTNESAKVKDERVVAAVRSVPEGLDRNAWRKWSIAAQVYMLGSDYAEGKSFSDVTKEIK